MSIAADVPVTSTAASPVAAPRRQPRGRAQGTARTLQGRLARLVSRAQAPDAPPVARGPFVYRIPVLGAIAREWAEGDKDFPLMLVLAFVSLWAVAVALWGLPALYLTAVALVPLMGVLLVLITLG
jgi:hypothetical protein